MTLFLRSGVGRIAMTVVVGALSLAIGVFTARALTASDAPAFGPEGPIGVRLGSVSEAPLRQLPVLAPIQEMAPGAEEALAAVGSEGTDTSTDEEIPAPTTDPPGSATIGEIEVDPPEMVREGDQSEEGEEAVYFPFFGITLFDQPNATDPCAGSEPGEDPPASCPPGVGSTVLAGGGDPSDPSQLPAVGSVILTSDSNYGTEVWQCPNDAPRPGPGEVGIGVWTRTPLSTLSISVRPLGTVSAPDPIDPVVISTTTVIEPATDPDYRARWESLFEDTGEAPGLVRCVSIPREDALSLEVLAAATDIFGRDVAITPGRIPAFDAVDWPPLSVGRDHNIVTVRAWSRPGGNVEFRTGTWLPDQDRPACSASPRVRRLFGQTNQWPAYTDFTTQWDAEVTVAPGTSEVVCVSVYDSDNPFDLLGEETLVVRSRDTWVPRLEAVEFWLSRDSANSIESGGLTIEASAAWCQSGWTIGIGASPGWVVSVPDEFSGLWNCPADAEGRPYDSAEPFPIQVDLTQPRDQGTPWQSSAVVMVDGHASSTPPGSSRYSVPLDLGQFLFRLTYDLVAGTGGSNGSWDVIETTRGLPPAPTDVLEVRWEHDLDLVQATGLATDTITLFTNRPVQITKATFHELGGDDNNRPCRSTIPGVSPNTVTPSGSMSTTSVLAIRDLCPGLAYDVVLTAVDENGDTHTLTAFDADQIVRVPPLRAVYDVELEFLTDEASALAVVDLGVRFDGSRSFQLFEPIVNGTRTPPGSCISDHDGVVTLLSWAAPTDPFNRSYALLEAKGSNFDIAIDFRIWRGCDSGLPALVMPRYELRASIPISQLNGTSNNPGLGGSAGHLGNTFVIDHEFGPDLSVRITLRPHALGTTWALRDGSLLGD